MGNPMNRSPTQGRALSPFGTIGAGLPWHQSFPIWGWMLHARCWMEWVCFTGEFPVFPRRLKYILVRMSSSLENATRWSEFPNQCSDFQPVVANLPLKSFQVYSCSQQGSHGASWGSRKPNQTHSHPCNTEFECPTKTCPIWLSPVVARNTNWKMFW